MATASEVAMKVRKFHVNHWVLNSKRVIQTIKNMSKFQVSPAPFDFKSTQQECPELKVIVGPLDNSWIFFMFFQAFIDSDNEDAKTIPYQETKKKNQVGGAITLPRIESNELNVNLCTVMCFFRKSMSPIRLYRVSFFAEQTFFALRFGGGSHRPHELNACLQGLTSVDPCAPLS